MTTRASTLRTRGSISPQRHTGQQPRDGQACWRCLWPATINAAGGRRLWTPGAGAPRSCQPPRRHSAESGSAQPPRLQAGAVKSAPSLSRIMVLWQALHASWGSVLRGQHMHDTLARREQRQALPTSKSSPGARLAAWWRRRPRPRGCCQATPRVMNGRSKPTLCNTSGRPVTGKCMNSLGPVAQRLCQGELVLNGSTRSAWKTPPACDHVEGGRVFAHTLVLVQVRNLDAGEGAVVVLREREFALHTASCLALLCTASPSTPRKPAASASVTSGSKFVLRHDGRVEVLRRRHEIVQRLCPGCTVAARVPLPGGNLSRDAAASANTVKSGACALVMLSSVEPRAVLLLLQRLPPGSPLYASSLNTS